MAGRGRPPGGPKTGGRKAGTPNKLNADIKAAIVEAFQNAGGSKYLTKVAKENPQVFCSLLGRVVPLQVGGDPENPMEMRIGWATSAK